MSELDFYATTSPPSQATTAVKPSKTRDVDELDEKPVLLKAELATLQTSESVQALAMLDEKASASTTMPTNLTDSADLDDDQRDISHSLWNAISPCWKRVSGTGTLPVTLKVTFAADGTLVEQPQIVRIEGARPSAPVLQSEEQAIRALRECGSYPMAADKRDIIVKFPAPQ